jgi:hexokinase
VYGDEGNLSVVVEVVRAVTLGVNVSIQLTVRALHIHVYHYYGGLMIPQVHFPVFLRELLVSRNNENPSPNLRCTKSCLNSTKTLPRLPRTQNPD